MMRHTAQTLDILPEVFCEHQLTFAPDWCLTSGGRCNLLPLCSDYLLQFTQRLANTEKKDSRLVPLKQSLLSPA